MFRSPPSNWLASLPLRSRLAYSVSFWVRHWPLPILASGVSFILLLRLAQLTLVEGSWYQQLADNNRTIMVPLVAPRGVIFDRHQIPLARNLPAYIELGTDASGDPIETLLDRDTAIKKLTDPDNHIRITANREYPCGSSCEPAIGYVGSVTKTDLTNTDYQPGDRIGKSGAESQFERQLKGFPGEEYQEVNAKGELQRVVARREPQPGNNLNLTLDSVLTQILVEAFAGQTGAAVALVPQTGEILSLVSLPAADPSQIAAAINDPKLPLLNRATGGAYPPGSTFKMVTALAALESGKIDNTTMFEDSGEIKIGDYAYGNWLYEEHGRTEGQINLVRALARSNDIFFYRVGEATGPNQIADTASLLGFGKTWGLGNWGEASGLVPTPDWKWQKRHERWFLGNTYHMAIGQGDVLVTPLQMAVMTAAIANQGVLCTPHLDAATKPVCQQLGLSETSLAFVHQGMIGACQPGGTGAAFFNFSPQVACKTGTAQQGGEKAEPHAWFTVYAPADHPTIALTVLVEQGGQGSTVAAPIAQKALAYYLSNP